MLSQFLAWWRTQLLALFRLEPQPGGARDGRALVISVLALTPGAPPVVELAARRRGQDGTLGRFTLDAAGAGALRAAAAGLRGPVLLRLPPGLLLEQRVILPLAAERDPERVLTYEMDRLTPFPAAELFWSWALDRRDPAANQLRLRVSLVPKARLAPVLDALAGAGLRPSALDAGAPDGTRRRLPLAQVRPGWWARRGPVLAGALCAVLAAAAAGLPFLQQHEEAARIEAGIAALRPRVDQAEALRRAVLGRAATVDVVQAERARVGDALGILAALTTVLPDDTHLTELTLRRRVLSVTGESGGAARLIAALEAEPGFRNPAFAAPVTRGADGRAEAFSLRAEASP